MAAGSEVIGTGLLASLVAVPYAKIFMDTEFGALFFVPPFFVSSISGVLLAWVLGKRFERHSLSVLPKQ